MKRKMPSDTVPLPTPHDTALLAARDRAVVCDLAPLSILAIAGADAAPFLQGQLSADIVGLPPGACRHASFNSPKGRMLANFVVWRDPAAPDRFLALVPGDIATPVVKRLAMYVLRSKVAIADVSEDFARLGVGGPAGGEALRAAYGSSPASYELQRSDSTTVLGLPGPRFAIIAPRDTADATRALLLRRADAASFEVWEWLTIRAGVPVITAATQDRFVAQTANLDLLAGIDFQKGCYTGQEIIARTQYLGRLKERAFLFHADSPNIAAGERLFNDAFGDQPCGTVVNAAAAPGGGGDLLAVLQLAAADRGDTRLGSPGGPALSPLPLPYAFPPAGVPRGRVT
ncbi:MAG: folate-binding protein [Betaproteobacteria bacterium]